MRPVKKGPGPTRLATRHATPPVTATDATAAWSSYNYKREIVGYCLHEQFWLCAFTEVRLDLMGLGLHLDHVDPKSHNPGRTFDYQNLFACAISSPQLKFLSAHDVFGGHFRRRRYSPVGFINPLRPDCRRFFHYASDGRIEPALGLSVRDARKARYTITVMNLNAPLLVAERRRVIQEIEDAIDDMLTRDVPLEPFAEAELCETNGRLQPFHSAVRERLGELGEKVMQQHCPNCG